MGKFSKVCIVGGGAAGWLTALYVNKISPKTKITLIESETIGILGAGEGSVPTLTEFLRFLDINESEFILETNATHKLGILFDN
jgi:tryptophan halogenase